MILQISTRNDESTFLPEERKRGDVFQVFDDSFIPGSIERATYFFIQIPDPPKLEQFRAALVASRYGNPASQNTDPPIEYFREWALKYWLLLDSSQIAIIDAASDGDLETPGFQAVEGVNYLPAGPLSGGGVVNNGVLSDRFTIANLTRK